MNRHSTKIDLYLDCEWFINQKMFLLGYSFNRRNYGQLYDDTLNREQVIALFRKVTGSVFFYGPDIGMIEKCFQLDIRSDFRCVNLLKVFKKEMPGLSSYRLAHIETQFGIYRSSQKYKANIFQLLNDWKNPLTKKLVLQYNQDDVLNMMELKLKIFQYLNIKDCELDKYCL